MSSTSQTYFVGLHFPGRCVAPLNLSVEERRAARDSGWANITWGLPVTLDSNKRFMTLVPVAEAASFHLANTAAQCIAENVTSEYVAQFFPIVNRSLSERNALKELELVLNRHQIEFRHTQSFTLQFHFDRL